MHNSAGGSGTYANPVTMGASKSAINIGSILYVPALKKYVVTEDSCDNRLSSTTTCYNDWTYSGQRDVFIWIGGNGYSSGYTLSQCDAALRNHIAQSSAGSVLVPNPPSNLAVDTTPLFNTYNNACS
jgi:hypothetical protein